MESLKNTDLYYRKTIITHPCLKLFNGSLKAIKIVSRHEKKFEIFITKNYLLFSTINEKIKYSFKTGIIRKNSIEQDKDFLNYFSKILQSSIKDRSTIQMFEVKV